VFKKTDFPPAGLCFETRNKPAFFEEDSNLKLKKKTLGPPKNPHSFGRSVTRGKDKEPNSVKMIMLVRTRKLKLDNASHSKARPFGSIC
jgi:hypothetical protein